MDANPNSQGLNPGEHPPPVDSPFPLELTKTLPAAAAEDAESLSLSGLAPETPEIGRAHV